MDNQTEQASNPNAAADAVRNAAAGVVSSLHGGVDKAAATAGNATLGVLPVIDRAAEGAHRVVDRVADSLEAPSDWIGKNPLPAVGLAFVAGLLIGRLAR